MEEKDEEGTTLEYDVEGAVLGLSNTKGKLLLGYLLFLGEDGMGRTVAVVEALIKN